MGGVSLHGSVRNPSAEQVDLVVSQSTLTGELDETQLRHPRRHVPALNRVHDQRETNLYVAITQEIERSRSVGMVARRAAREQDRGDVSVESH